MSTYDLGKSVAVLCDDNGRPWHAEVGLNTDGTVFGYVSRGTLTHMSYRLDKYFVPADVVAARREEGIPFYFHTGDRLSISADELERAFRELGLL